MNDLELLQAAVETMAKEAASERRPFAAAVLTAAADSIECWRLGKEAPEPRAQPEGAPAARAGLPAAKRGRPKKERPVAPPAGEPRGCAREAGCVKIADHPGECFFEDPETGDVGTREQLAAASSPGAAAEGSVAP
jgi:hypothetical protein